MKHRAIWLSVALALVCAGVAVWWGALNQDEGWYLYSARMWNEGLLPYKDYFFTQGPALPAVYGALYPVWSGFGILGGRVVTVLFGLMAALLAALFARETALGDAETRESRRPAATAAAWATFVLLAGCIYHVYFNTIPKTYALGSFFLTAGFLFYALPVTRLRGFPRAVSFMVSGFLMALASGTRISLALVPFVAGFALLLRTRRFGASFLWYGIGAGAGLALTYGFFALDEASLKGLMAAQAYHAARGGFDLMFVIGSVSRLLRGYAGAGALFAVAIAIKFASRDKSAKDDSASSGISRSGSFLVEVAVVSFAAVFVLQLSAPFPYDDYQVPVMPLAVAAVSVWWALVPGRRTPCTSPLLPLLFAAIASFSSPLLQEWATYGMDRFWSVKKTESALSQLRGVAQKINSLDPGGTEIFTQDLYLAVETGRKVPRGMEMGPFCYFPDLPDEEAKSLHVMNIRLMANEIFANSARIAAGSGYAFAIAAPTCAEVPVDMRRDYWNALKSRYTRRVIEEERFGQNSTPLLVMVEEERR